MAADANEALVRRIIEAVNARDDDALDDLIADGVVGHALLYQPVLIADGAPVPVPEGGVATTREQRRRLDARRREEVPDEQLTIEALYSAGDIVTAVLTHRGTHRSGKAVTWKAVTIHRIAGGRLVELWRLWDRLGYYQQLGVVPATPGLLRQIGAVR
jgi:ketosteroid isomerase-like protein